MKQCSISSNNKQVLSRNCGLFRVRTKLDAFQSKEEKLFGNKSFLEIILGLIKKTQSDVLSNTAFHKKKGAFNYSMAKIILKEFKKDLISINEEEKKKVQLHENLLIEKKKKIKEIIFNQNNSKCCMLDSCNGTEINLKTEQFVNGSGDVDPRKELVQLKILNFKLENEINKVDFLSKRLFFEKEYNKNYYIENKIKLDRIYIKQNDNKIVNQILHNKLITRRKIFIRKANMKNNQDFCINGIKDRIYQFKKDIRDLYQYYNNQIISEEEKSYIETIVEDMKKDDMDEDSLNEDSINNIEMDKKITKDDLDSIDKNSSNKDSSNNEETCPNSSEKYRIEINN